MRVKLSSILTLENLHPVKPTGTDKGIRLTPLTDNNPKLMTPLEDTVLTQGDNQHSAGEPGSLPHSNIANTSNAHKNEEFEASLKGGVIPGSEFKPGMQSNVHRDHRREVTLCPILPQDSELSQAETLTWEMLSIGTKTQDLSKQYHYRTRGISDQNYGQPGGPGRRSVNFLDTIEIIPTYRKSEYSRESDRHATFRMLTSNLKNEIRNELNSYKVREMAVHVDSMQNTTFH
ncbi:MAG: hypothetical protein J3Q66DRAFT_417374 [Benniella sp.]|nr:MAG: hypothetical protein J3Q66DRAFT_417374 [Benniella sp.]